MTRVTTALAGAIGLMAMPATAQTATPGARDRATVLLSEDAQERSFQERLGYADVVAIDGTLYLSGVVAELRGGNDTMDAAYDRAFQKIGRTLERAGASWRDVVDMTSYHTDVLTQLAAISKVKNRYVAAPPPAWTAIGVSRLLPDRGITEIKIVARLPDRRR